MGIVQDIHDDLEKGAARLVANIVIGCDATPPKRKWRRVAQVYLWSYGETTYQIHSPVQRND